ncbi:eglS [Symbiodinium natans]|nr:eglS [Symbiodinium natans]
MVACHWDATNRCCRQDGVPSPPFALSDGEGFATCHNDIIYRDDGSFKYCGDSDFSSAVLPVSCGTRTTETTSTTTTVLADWLPVTVWENQACSGSNDDFLVSVAPGLEACKARCVAMSPFCKGVEYTSATKRCELWTPHEGIQRTYGAAGTVCLKYTLAPVFSPLEGGIDRACRGATPTDNPPENYIVVEASSLQECQETCAKWQGCKGVEYNFYTRCEIWTRAQGIQAVQYVPGHTCMNYTDGGWTQSGMKSFQPPLYP